MTESVIAIVYNGFVNADMINGGNYLYEAQRQKEIRKDKKYG